MNTEGNDSPKPKLLVLVIDNNFAHNTSEENNWAKNFEFGISSCLGNSNLYDDNDVPKYIFSELTEHFDIIVDQADWNEISLVSYLDSPKPKRACVRISQKKSSPIMESQKRNRIVFPNLILMRTLPYAQTNKWDYRNTLLGFIHSGVPCINSAKSIWCNELEKPLMIAGLKAIQDRVGEKEFPLINQYYYSNYNEMGFIPGLYPQVVKVAHMDAGFGKMKVDNEQAMKDLSSIVCIHGDYCTSEPFIEGQYDLRIQKIGSKIRAFKRTGMSWKTNVESLEIVEIPLTPEYVRWANEASNLNGEYMDILTVDAVVSAEDESKKYILEVNGCSSGIPYLTDNQDKHAIFCLCMQRLHELYAKPVSNEENRLSDIRALDKNTELCQLRNELEQTRLSYNELMRNHEKVNKMLRTKSNKPQLGYYKMPLIAIGIGFAGIAVGLYLYSWINFKA